MKSTEPTAGDDNFPPNKKPHPNPLDKVEGAFHDALELAAAALTDPNTNNNTIFLHYFAKRDKAKVRKVYQAILGPTEVPKNLTSGNELFSKLHVQRDDPKELCDDDTLAYTHAQDTESPYIVLCLNAFKKKGRHPNQGCEEPC